MENTASLARTFSGETDHTATLRPDRDRMLITIGDSALGFDADQVRAWFEDLLKLARES